MQYSEQYCALYCTAQCTLLFTLLLVLPVQYGDGNNALLITLYCTLSSSLQCTTYCIVYCVYSIQHTELYSLMWTVLGRGCTAVHCAEQTMSNYSLLQLVHCPVLYTVGQSPTWPHYTWNYMAHSLLTGPHYTWNYNHGSLITLWASVHMELQPWLTHHSLATWNIHNLTALLTRQIFNSELVNQCLLGLETHWHLSRTVLRCLSRFGVGSSIATKMSVFGGKFV